MAGLFSILHLGNQSLQTSQFQIRTASENISNAGTPGFHRRTAIQRAGDPYRVGHLMYGTGAEVHGTQRSADETLDRRVRVLGSQARGAEVRSGLLARAGAVFGELSGGGAVAALDGFFGALDGLATAPGDQAARVRALSSAEHLAAEVRRYGAELRTQREELNADVASGVNTANRLAGQLAELNQQLGGETSPPADLLDRQAALLDELSGVMGIAVLRRPNGSVDVTMPPSGYGLVVGNETRPLSTQAGPDGLLRVNGRDPGGVRDLTGAVSGGSLGGTLRARDQDLAAVGAGLDRFAYELAGAVNAVHSAGFGTDGVGGRDLFAAPAQVAGAAEGLRLDAAVAGNPAALAAATDPTRVPGDNRGALALAALRELPSVGGQTPGAALRAVLSDLGDRANGALVSATSSREAASHLEMMRESVSGVSIDEEMTSLLRFRQTYAAAAQIIRTADELIQNVIALKR